MKRMLGEFESKLDFLKEQKRKDHHEIAVSWLLLINLNDSLLKVLKWENHTKT